MRNNLHPWGVYERTWNRRGFLGGEPGYKLVSHHKTRMAAENFIGKFRSTYFVRRTRDGEVRGKFVPSRKPSPRERVVARMGF